MKGNTLAFLGYSGGEVGTAHAQYNANPVKKLKTANNSPFPQAYSFVLKMRSLKVNEALEMRYNQFQVLNIILLKMSP